MGRNPLKKLQMKEWPVDANMTIEERRIVVHQLKEELYDLQARLTALKANKPFGKNFTEEQEAKRREIVVQKINIERQLRAHVRFFSGVTVTEYENKTRKLRGEARRHVKDALGTIKRLKDVAALTDELREEVVSRMDSLTQFLYEDSL